MLGLLERVGVGEGVRRGAEAIGVEKQLRTRLQRWLGVGPGGGFGFVFGFGFAALALGVRVRVRVRVRV